MMNTEAQAALSFLPEADFETLARLELDQERSLLLEADSVAFIRGDDETRFQLDRSLAVQLSRADDKLLVELRQRSSDGWRRQRLLAPYSGIDSLALSYAGNADGRLWTVDTQTLRTLLARLRASMQLDGGENWLLPTAAAKSSFQQRLERLQRTAQPSASGLHFQARQGLLELRRPGSSLGAVLLTLLTLGALFFFLLLLMKPHRGVDGVLVVFGLIPTILGLFSALAWRASRAKVLFSLKDDAIVTPMQLPSPLRVLGASTGEQTLFVSWKNAPALSHTLTSAFGTAGTSGRGKLWSSRLHLEVPENNAVREAALLTTAYAAEADWITQVLACWFGVDGVSTELSSERNRWPLLEDEAEGQSLLEGNRQEQVLTIRTAKGTKLEVDRRLVAKVDFGGDEMRSHILLSAADGRRRHFFARHSQSSFGHFQEEEKRGAGTELELKEFLRLYAHLSALSPTPCRLDSASLASSAGVKAIVRDGELHLHWVGSWSGWTLAALAVLGFSILLILDEPKGGSAFFLVLGLPSVIGFALAAYFTREHWVADKNGLWRQGRRERRFLAARPRAGWVLPVPDLLKRNMLMLDTFTARFGSPLMSVRRAEALLKLLGDWFGFSDPPVFPAEKPNESPQATLTKLSDAQDLFAPSLDD
ncbi:MAG: hypothetical protein RBU37_15900 [Myxococcota bacterium]|jgi:hypothetical protein|nr:hypothetical protein [Myxococcota bacterium]